MSVLKKRSIKGIWANLYEFPLIETLDEVGYSEFLNKVNEEKLFIEAFDLSLYNDEPIVHHL